MENAKKNYVAPSIEIIEIESESTVMQGSVPPINGGNPMFGSLNIDSNDITNLNS